MVREPDLAINRSQVQIPADALPNATWTSCLHACASVTEQYNSVPANGAVMLADGEVTPAGPSACPDCYRSAQLRHQWTTNMEQSASRS